MKKPGILTLFTASILWFSACDSHLSGSQLPTDGIPALLEATLPNLSKNDITEGDINTLPISASNENGDELTLFFYTFKKVYLPSGTYTFGREAGQYTGHFKNSLVEGDIILGNLTVTIDGDEDYAIQGTVRLNDQRQSAVKIRASGKLVYDFETEYYYTFTRGVKIGENSADIYRIYSKEEIKSITR